VEKKREVNPTKRYREINAVEILYDVPTLFINHQSSCMMPVPYWYNPTQTNDHACVFAYSIWKKFVKRGDYRVITYGKLVVSDIFISLVWWGV
jgi:hypothetical protein